MANDIHVTRDPDATLAGAPRVTQGTPIPPAAPVAPVADTGAAEPSLGQLFKELAQESSMLIRQEVALAKTEISKSVSKAATDAVSLVVWGAVAAVGALVLVACLVLALGDLLDNYWLSALIVGGLFVIVGGALAMGALKKLKSVSLAPETTIQTLKEDKQWAQAEAQHVKRELTR